MKNIRLTELLVLLALLALLGCSHDAKRENPLDPVLTPYSGDTRFDSYLILRNVANRTDVDTLSVITEAEQTTYTDASLAADTAYEYRILVVNGEGFASSSERSGVDGFSVLAVTLLAAAGDPSAGAIEITWTQYRDPGFDSYQLFRRVVGTDVELLLGNISSVTDMTFADSTARHGVGYIYRVAAETASGSLSSAGFDARLNLPAVTLTSAEFDASSGSASLDWTPYSGPRFSHYRIERKDEGGWTAVDSLVQVDDIDYVDAELRGNVEYAYRVVTGQSTNVRGGR